MTQYIYEDQLQSQRLLTRWVKPGDAATWAAFMLEPGSTDYLNYYGVSDPKARAEQWIERQLKRYDNKQYGLQILTDKQNGAFIGMSGLLIQEIDGVPEMEIGYHLFSQYRGKGYAAEAARLFKDYAFQNKQCASITSIIHVDNIPSQRVATSNGMTIEKQCLWNNMNVYVFRVHAPIQ